MEQGRYVITNALSHGLWPAVWAIANTKMNLYGDSIQATFEAQFGGINDTSLIAGKRKGVFSWMTSNPNPFSQMAWQFKSRTFYPQPTGAENFYFAKGNFWRYNDVNFNPAAKWYNNTYDANDISPYCEYPAKPAYVIDTFRTRNYNNTGDTLVHYGDKGRVILGYSDNRIAQDNLLRVDTILFFQGSTPQAAKTFSATLDFNIDESSIDTALATGRQDSLLPLMIFQVLFKRGQTSSRDTGQAILPFVPFADASHSGTLYPGWYKVEEVVVTKHVYDSLIRDNDYSWRAEDTLQNGSVSHSWRFMQLHTLLSLPSVAQVVANTGSTDSIWALWGQGSGYGPLTQFSDPDTLVHLDQNIDTLGIATIPLLEIRVLSTYRATVRVRGLDYHDTIVDKFLYRKRIAGTTDSTHSCNPNGAIGGYDDSVSAMVQAHSPHDNVTQEFMFNDTQPEEAGAAGPLSTPMVAYLDFMGSKRNLYGHWREQDDGSNALQYRRFRVSFNGQPPSVFENQYTFFGGHIFAGSFALSNSVVFPQDYDYYSALDAPSVVWPSSGDTLVGIITARRATSDPDSAYHVYESEAAGFSAIFLSDGITLKSMTFYDRTMKIDYHTSGTAQQTDERIRSCTVTNAVSDVYDPTYQYLPPYLWSLDIGSMVSNVADKETIVYYPDSGSPTTTVKTLTSISWGMGGLQSDALHFIFSKN
jgi:hypothetical protein